MGPLPEENKEVSHENPAQPADTPAEAEATPFSYPPKYEKEDQQANIWTRSLISLAAYLVLGFYVFNNLVLFFNWWYNRKNAEKLIAIQTQTAINNSCRFFTKLCF